jgi:hypothetical protein
MSDDIPSNDALASALAPPQGLPAADNSFDLSLRLLTWLVMVALAGSVSLLVYRWIAPRLEEGNAGPVHAKVSQPAPAPAAPDQGPLHRDEVLMDPGRVFRCEEQGRVTFSDQACSGGGPAAPPTGAAHAPTTTGPLPAPTPAPSVPAASH